MKMRIFFLMTVILTVLAASGQSGREKAVVVAVEHLRKAMIDGNKTELGNLVSDKLSYGHSSGHIDNKKDFIDNLVSGKSDFVTIDLSEQSVILSGKTAIVRHKLSATTNDGGKPGEVRLLVMLVWQKQGNKWILLARQAVKII